MMRYYEVFGYRKPVIAMLHMKGDARKSPLERAKEETELYLSRGVDAVLVENYFGSAEDCRQVLDWLSRQSGALCYGVNILGDMDLGFRLAREYGAAFLQLDSVCGHLAPFQDDMFARKLAQLRKTFDGAVLGGVRFKYQPVCSGRTEEEDLRLGMERCDAVVVTGTGTGIGTPVEKMRRFRKTLGDFPMVVGAGCTVETVPETFEVGDGAIVGSYFKEAHNAMGDVEAAYVARFMEAKCQWERSRVSWNRS